MISNIERLIERSYSPPALATEGYWRAIQFRPDFATSELLNVGVFFTSGSESSIRLLDSFDKFARVYGESSEDELRFVLRAVRVALSNAEDVSGIPSVELTEPQLARGTTPQDVVDRLFPQIVSFNGTAFQSKRDKPKFVNNSTLRLKVFDLIRKKAGVSAEQIIAADSDLRFSERGSSVYLDIPLRTAKGLGTVVSAGFSKSENVERSLLRAFADLTVGRAIAGAEYSGLFVYRPTGLLSPSNQSRIDNVIDLAEWKFRRSGITVDVSDDPDKLASDIVEWGHESM